MIKKTLTTVLATSMLFTMSNNVLANQSTPLKIEINGIAKEFSQQPVLFHDITLVPIRGVFESLDAEVKWDSTNQKITVIKEENVVELKVGNKEATKNLKPIKLLQEPILIDGHAMVPLRFISESIGANVMWDSSQNLIVISLDESPEDNKEIIDTTLENNLGNFESTLTYGEALDLALKNSNKIRNENASIERAEEIRDKAGDNMTTYPSGYGNGAADALARRAFIGLKQASIGEDASRKQLEIAKESIAYSVKKAYNEVLTAAYKYNLSQKTLNYQNAYNKIIEQKQKVGLVSDFDLFQADKNLSEAKSQLQKDEQSLIDAYEKLNLLIGKSDDARYSISDIPKYFPLDNENVDIHVTQVLSDSTAVWLAEQKVDIAKLSLETYTFNDPTNPDTYRAKEIDVEKAKYAVIDTKDQLESTIRSLYNNIKAIESQYNILMSSLAKAEEAQKLIKTKYDQGMATSIELLEANLNVEKIEQQIFGVISQLDYMKLAYEKPWVAG